MSDAYRSENLSDLGNARRLVRHNRELLRYSEVRGGWYWWDETRWLLDETRAVELAAKDTVRAMYREAEELSDSERQALIKHALKSESEARLRAMLNLARSEPDVAVHPSDFDADPWLFNVANGTVDLRTGQLRPHRRRDLITKVAPVAYDPDADAPTWREFLGEVLSPDVAAYLQRAVGLSMIGEIREHVLLFLYGLGANGKTTFLRVVQALFGDYAKQAESELLLVRRGDAHPTGIADLHGSRIVVTTEVSDGRRMAESLVKGLTGGDRVKARFMHRDFFEFEPSWTIWLAANHKPVIRGTDDGIWRRVRLIPFEVTIPPDDQDPELPKKLEMELPGILNWAVAGVTEYLRDGMREPLDVLAATNEYRAESDILGGFLEQETERDPDASVLSSILYKRYTDWADQAGERAVSQRRFGTALAERGFGKGKDPDTRRVTYAGIRLRPDRPKPSETFATGFSHEEKY